MATDASDRDAQRRELAEIRRKFTEMGARVGSLFDPAPEEDHDPQPALPAPAPWSRPPWLVVAAAVAVALLVGVGLGHALPHQRARAPTATPQPPATAAPAPIRAVQTRTVTSVPSSCLEAARKGDLTIHLYTINVRDRRLVEALKAYTLASQACRREASP
jgi:hypothetical protein